MGTGPISTNAPFNEFGNSMILRDIEQLYLLRQALQGQVATLQDLVAGLESTVSGIPAITYPIAIANGGTGATTVAGADAALGIIGTTMVVKTSGTSFTVPAGVTRMRVIVVGGGGSGARVDASPFVQLGWIASSGGGATTQSLYLNYGTGSGATGGLVICEMATVPGDSITYAIGAGGTYPGAGPAFGNNGTASTMTYGSVSAAAAGGYGGTPGASGYAPQGGSPGNSFLSGTAGYVLGGLRGESGSDGVSVGGSSSVRAVYGQDVYLITINGTLYGYGGISDGGGGAVVFIY